jgi:hypothetical protein
MIRTSTIADVAITEVTIWQQCGYNVPRQEGRENVKYLISEYVFVLERFIVYYMDHKLLVLPLFIIVSENSPY